MFCELTFIGFRERDVAELFFVWRFFRQIKKARVKARPVSFFFVFQKKTQQVSPKLRK